MKPDVALAYDNLATHYDEDIKGDEWVREQLWQLYLRRFRPGMRILDVACGTGIDSLYLAGQGFEVTGVDVSPGMIARLQLKSGQSTLTKPVQAVVGDVDGLANWPAAQFDGIVSGFAGLSAVADLGAFAATAARLLRPGGGMIVHMLNRFSLWEWLGLLAHRRWSEARQVGRQQERLFVVGGVAVPHYLWTAADSYQHSFAPHFALRQGFGMGILRPPGSVHRFPRSLAVALGGLERRVHSYRPFVNWGRFFVLDLARRDEAAAG
jgi:ubiquinone/menaquinone biosynthesis C-methylase UbiE